MLNIGISRFVVPGCLFAWLFFENQQKKQTPTSEKWFRIVPGRYGKFWKKSKIFDIFEVRWSNWGQCCIDESSIEVYLASWECWNDVVCSKNDFQKIHFAWVILVNFVSCELSWMGVSGAEPWPVAVIFPILPDAPHEGAWGFQRIGKVGMSKISVLASLGLNSYPRGTGGEGCETARRRIAPPRSLEFFRFTRTERYF